MPILNINLEEVEGQLKLMEGVFPVEIKSCKAGKSKAMEDKLTFITEILDGTYDFNDGKGVVSVIGEKILINLSLQPQALWKFRQLRDVCGVDSGNTIDTDLFLNTKLKVSCSLQDIADNTGRNSKRTQVDDFMPYEAA